MMALIKATQRAQLYELTEDDVDEMAKDLDIWMDYISGMVAAGVLLPPFSTPNHHHLHHVTSAIRSLGPLRMISACCMERTIRDYKQDIRSKNDSGANAQNALLNKAAMAYVTRDGLVDDDDDEDGSNLLGKVQKVGESLQQLNPAIQQLTARQREGLVCARRVNVRLRVYGSGMMTGKTRMIFLLPTNNGYKTYAGDVKLYIRTMDTIYALATMLSLGHDSTTRLFYATNTTSSASHDHLVPAKYILSEAGSIINNDRHLLFWDCVVCDRDTNILLLGPPLSSLIIE